MILNKLSAEQHVSLVNKEVGDSAVLFNYVFEIISCDYSQDSNLIYYEYVAKCDHPIEPPRYFTYKIVCSIYGYDDYGYEALKQDYSFIEVEKKEVTTYTWVHKL